MLVAAVVERRRALHLELNRPVHDLDLPYKPRERCAVLQPRVVGPLGHEQVRHDADALLAEELCVQHIRAGQVALFWAELARRRDGEVAALLGVDDAREHAASEAKHTNTHLGESKYGTHIISIAPSTLTHAAVCRQHGAWSTLPTLKLPRSA